MLKPLVEMEIPEETIRTAKAAFPKGNIYMTLRDELGRIFDDSFFAGLYPSLGQPAESPAHLALVTIMQFAENLTDRQAAEAVRSRIDWKYGLGLELSDPGFHYSILSEFRQRLTEGKAEQVLLDKLIEQCAMQGLLKGKNKQRTDSTHILAAVRSLTLLELVGETMRRLLDEISLIAPEWLREHMQPEWIKRYGRRFDSFRLPKSKEKRDELAMEIGKDGYTLIQAIYLESTPEELKSSAKVEILRRIWVQQYYICDGNVHWRTKKKWGQPVAGHMISSPDDPDIHYCVKRSTEWTGYKVHLTETCEADHPRLITHVKTTSATVHDVKVTAIIQDELAEKGLSPKTHLVDEGYMEIDLLVGSQKKRIDLVGPVPSSKSWQDREEDAFDHSQFYIDWKKMDATCPGGKTSMSCSKRKTWRNTPNLVFVFDKQDCFPCPSRKQCSRAKNVGRTLTIYPQEQYKAQQRARERQKTEEFKELYGERAGIESTISQGLSKSGLRRSRYIGLGRTHLQHIATAAAINVMRIFNWLSGERPQATRVSPFLAFAAQL